MQACGGLLGRKIRKIGLLGKNVYRGFLAMLLNTKTNGHFSHKTLINFLCGWPSWPKVFMKAWASCPIIFIKKRALLGFVSKH